MNHGTSGYRKGCRCTTCSDAMKAYGRDRYAAVGRSDRPTVPVRLVEPAPIWHRFAACRPEYADRPLDQWTALWFPGRGEASAEARQICAECPARQACADQALADREKYGIWGGGPANVNADGDAAKSA